MPSELCCPNYFDVDKHMISLYFYARTTRFEEFWSSCHWESILFWKLIFSRTVIDFLFMSFQIYKAILSEDWLMQKATHWY